MAKKKYKMTKVEMFDTFIPIIATCWVLVFAYISLFTSSNTLALITVMPIFFLYSLYLIGSAVYCYKELDILKAMEKDTYEVEKKWQKIWEDNDYLGLGWSKKDIDMSFDKVEMN